MKRRSKASLKSIFTPTRRSTIVLLEVGLREKVATALSAPSATIPQPAHSASSLSFSVFWSHSAFPHSSSAVLVLFFSWSPSQCATRHWLLSILILVLRHQKWHWYTYLVKLEEPHHQFSIYHNLIFGGKLLMNNSELKLC
ncbi:uncharacterized protein LOC107629401 isoform X4 [Arachis ipaensis]|uniref:uncharacterized protein LOC107629401 isoform X4 n=1 Tax=Arachis ipaensis TaxID=130454 RepID=UPI0007AFDECE|nr:uncharacterized protein LOC107629401 isoform X4 [Arachis ipaensis]XP_025627632.1 uncharacterized protein LOC112720769 isoform X5 [Arachis hypogaea]